MHSDRTVKIATTAVLLATTAGALAHPGHVPTPGPVHGLSWIELALLVVALGLPAVAFAARRLGRRFRMK